jgi:hypothetical protein
MISGAYIKEWQQKVPWPRNDQVEQDLIICRALVKIFSHPVLADNLAFRVRRGRAAEAQGGNQFPRTFHGSGI